MTTRIVLGCGIVICAITYAVTGDDQLWVGMDAGDPVVTRESANRIERALRSRAECNFVDKPLAEACQYIEDVYRIPIWIDKQSFQDEGINVDTQVTLVKSGITLDTILRLLLEPLGLAHITEDGVLQITTQTRADERMRLRIYPVGDLVTLGTQPDDYALLIALIKKTTSGKWFAGDGEGGNLIAFPNARSLAIRQTEIVHREIGGILAAIRKAKQVQHLASIPVSPNDPDELSLVEAPLADRRPMLRETRAVPTWQRPRVHAAE
jgi:hypothetical protein